MTSHRSPDLGQRVGANWEGLPHRQSPAGHNEAAPWALSASSQAHASKPERRRAICIKDASTAPHFLLLRRRTSLLSSFQTPTRRVLFFAASCITLMNKIPRPFLSFFQQISSLAFSPHLWLRIKGGWGLCLQGFKRPFDFG